MHKILRMITFVKYVVIQIDKLLNIQKHRSSVFMHEIFKDF
jgi:hypothetical protein